MYSDSNVENVLGISEGQFNLQDTAKQLDLVTNAYIDNKKAIEASRAAAQDAKETELENIEAQLKA